MTGHTPWSKIKHKKPPWWNPFARMKRWNRKRHQRALLEELTREGEDWPGGYR